MKLKSQHDSIGYLLVQVCKVRRNKTNEMLSESDIHAGQDVLLYYLSSDDGQTVSALVEKMGIQHATISNMIDRMEANGLLSRVKDIHDKRTSRVFLTDKGKAGEKSVREIWRELEAKTSKGMNEKEKVELRKLLQKVLINISS